MHARFAAAVLLLCASVAYSSAPLVSKKIWLTKPGTGPSTNIFELKAVNRWVSATAPATACMNKLLAGPTAAEAANGYMKPDCQMLKFVNFSISGTHWKPKFVKLPGHYWNGTLSIPRFAEAVKKTLLQFPTVTQVTVYVNGTANQNNW